MNMDFLAGIGTLKIRLYGMNPEREARGALKLKNKKYAKFNIVS